MWRELLKILREKKKAVNNQRYKVVPEKCRGKWAKVLESDSAFLPFPIIKKYHAPSLKYAM